MQLDLAEFTFLGLRVFGAYFWSLSVMKIKNLNTLWLVFSYNFTRFFIFVYKNLKPYISSTNLKLDIYFKNSFFSVCKLEIWKLKSYKFPDRKNYNARINVSWISLYQAVVSRILIAWWSGFKLLRKIFVFCHFYFPWFSENLSAPNPQPLNGCHETFPQKNISPRNNFGAALVRK